MYTTIPNTKSNDQYYRYKREISIISKTKKCFIWKNFYDICSQLHVKSEHMLKHFKKIMNQSIQESKEGIKFRSMSIDIEEFIEAYICKYVLCKMCGLPELNDKICNACGYKYTK